MLNTNQVDFFDFVFGDKAGTVTETGDLNIYIPSQRELDQQLNMDEFLDNSELTLAPEFTQDTLLDDICVPAQDIVMAPNEIEQTPSTSGSQEYAEQLVFQFPPTIGNESFQTLLASDISEDLITTTYVDSPAPSTPFSPSSSYSESLPPPTPDTASSMESVSSHIPTFLRQGLKSSILEKRRKQGKEDIKVEFLPPPPEQLTPEEEERRKEKRERNKLAAQKCRSKKRAIADVLEAETKELAKQQKQFRLEIKQLIEERDHLMDILKIHGSVCPAMKAKLRKS